MKRCIADGSVGFPHVRVGHRQASKNKTPIANAIGVFLFMAPWLSPSANFAAGVLRLDAQQLSSSEALERTGENQTDRLRNGTPCKSRFLW